MKFRCKNCFNLYGSDDKMCQNAFRIVNKFSSECSYYLPIPCVWGGDYTNPYETSCDDCTTYPGNETFIYIQSLLGDRAKAQVK